MFAIVNVDQNWAIGNKGDLLVNIPADMKMFRAATTGKTVIYGRKTLATFPGGKPLPKRENIILSRNPDFTVEGAVVVHSVEELLELQKTRCEEEWAVIGGDSVYRLLLPYCDTVLVTKTERTSEADTWFPNLDQDPEWKCVSVGEDQEYEGIHFHFDRYERI